MNPLLIDTSGYAAFKRGDLPAIATIEQAPLLTISTVVLGELFAGFAAGRREAANRDELAQFLALPNVRVLTVDATTADYYGQIYLQLRRAGTPIPTNDLWIAAAALQHGCDVFTYDAHFRMVGGLRSGASLSELNGTGS